jgi:HEPN domain-containing protein
LRYEVVAMPPSFKDDFAAAARRHLSDAAVLFDRQRWDGTVYLSGYVTECALKLLVERWLGMIGSEFSHRLSDLEAAVLGAREFELLVALSPTMRPLRIWRQVAGTVVDQKHPERRYFADGWSAHEAEIALEFASEVYERTLAEDVLDGRLPL